MKTIKRWLACALSFGLLMRLISAAGALAAQDAQSKHKKFNCDKGKK